MNQDPYSIWCVKHQVQHGHCPVGCEKPQPAMVDEKLFCGRCLVDGIFSEMIPCTPDVCD